MHADISSARRGDGRRVPGYRRALGRGEHRPLERCGCGSGLQRPVQPSKTIKVQVGQVLHPMTEEHYISMIILETDKGFQVKNLTPLQSPTATFVLPDDEKLEKVYAYCNLHGIWA